MKDSIPGNRKNDQPGPDTETGKRVDKYKAGLYTIRMIKSFRHKGIEQFFKTGTKAGIKPNHANRLRLQLAKLDSAVSPDDMALPGWRLHSLKGDLLGYWAVWVDRNWRLVFTFDGEDACLVDYMDYH